MISRREVAVLQKALNERAEAGLAVNGIFDDATRDAVVAFQAFMQLEPTGEADLATLRLLDLPQLTL